MVLHPDSAVPDGHEGDPKEKITVKVNKDKLLLDCARFGETKMFFHPDSAVPDGHKGFVCYNMQFQPTNEQATSEEEQDASSSRQRRPRRS